MKIFSGNVFKIIFCAAKWNVNLCPEQLRGQENRLRITVDSGNSGQFSISLLHFHFMYP